MAALHITDSNTLAFFIKLVMKKATSVRLQSDD